MYEIVITATGDRAEADTPAGVLLAARTLASDATSDASAARRIRRTAIVTRDGQYDGPTTNAARA